MILKESINIPIEVGDTVLGGKFKNKKIVVNDIGKNERGEPTINGKNLLNYRLVKKEKMESLKESINQFKLFLEGFSSGEDLVKYLNRYAFQPIKNTSFAAKLMEERIKLNHPLFNHLSNDKSSGKFFKKMSLDPTWGVFFVDINYLSSHKGNAISQDDGYKSVDKIKALMKQGKKMDSIPGFEFRDNNVGEGNHRIEALKQLGYKSCPVQIWGAW